MRDTSKLLSEMTLSMTDPGACADTACWPTYRHPENKHLKAHQYMILGWREGEVLYILCPASSLLDLPGYVNPDKLMNMPTDWSAGIWC